MYYIVGTLIDDTRNRELADCVKCNDPAANRYQKSLREGFVENGLGVNCYSYKTVSPKYYKEHLVELKKYASLKQDVVIKKKSYLLNFIQQIWFFYRKLLKKVKDGDFLVVYSLDSSRLLACQFIKRIRKVNTCVVITDLPEYMSGKKGLRYIFLKKVNNVIIDKALENFDYYVLLSEYMQERLPIKKERCVIVEGIYLPMINGLQDGQKEKFVLYTGSVSKRYGVQNLVDAFCLLPDMGFKLMICGNGEQDVIDSISNRDRVMYLGVLPYDEVVNLQKKAYLLVNPRSPIGEYVKYSFPSKTMEYFASGTPVLMYKLPGVPNEYYDYCYSLEDVSVKSLACKLKEVLGKNEDELRQMGKRAQEFIMNNKLAKSQCRRIIDFINN